jgi:hypothetical protein
MTGYTVHTGSSIQFSDGWDKIFAKGSKAKKKSAAPTSAAKKTTGAKKKTGTKKRGSR